MLSTLISLKNTNKCQVFVTLDNVQFKVLKRKNLRFLEGLECVV